mgnify:CR=1 FL=1
MNPSRWIGIGAVLGALGVAAGAFGAHGLEGQLRKQSAATSSAPTEEASPAQTPERKLHTFEVAVRYQMYHALALVLVGKAGWMTNALQAEMRSREQVDGRFRWLDKVDDGFRGDAKVYGLEYTRFAPSRKATVSLGLRRYDIEFDRITLLGRTVPYNVSASNWVFNTALTVGFAL